MLDSYVNGLFIALMTVGVSLFIIYVIPFMFNPVTDTDRFDESIRKILEMAQKGGFPD